MLKLFVIRSKLRSSVQSLVPLLHRRLGSAQAAVDHTTQILIENVAGFVEAAERLLASHSVPEADGNTQLHDFVEGCRLYCSGNLVWRYEYPVPKRKLRFPTLCFNMCVCADFASPQSQDTAVRY